MAVTRAIALGCGHFLPDRIVENAAFTDTLDTSDEWIRTRTGIERRHFAADGQVTSDLAVHAAQDALARAGVDAREVDAIVLATSTPDETFPSTATKVQHAIGMGRGFAFDVQAVCAGFIFALGTANALIIAGQARTVLVIGAETFSRIMDWQDRGTCVLFGDGAGALVLRADRGSGQPSDRGVLSVDLNSDGAHHDILYVDGGVSSTQTTGVLRMEGKEVFRHAVAKLAETGQAALDQAGLSQADIDWLVPHQANLRILKSTAQKMGLPMDRVIQTVQDHGNTSAASIPLALAHGLNQGHIAEGDLLLLEGIGGGLVWGAAALRW